VRSRALGIILLALASVTAWPAAHVSASDVADMSVSPANPDKKTNYGPIFANNSQNTLPHKPSDCRSATYCDVIDVKVDPSAYPSNEFYQLTITLFWEHSTDVRDTPVGNAEAVDLDLYVYDPKEIKVAQDAGATQPATTSLDTPQLATYYVVINSSSGPNTGYTVEAELEDLGKAKAIPKFQRPESSGAPNFTPLPEASGIPGVPTPPRTNLEPGATLAPVITPGPDGSLQSLGLEGVQAGGNANGGGGITWWGYLIMSVAIAGVGSGAGLIVFRRLRRA
jgi:hypothetical protein